MLLPRRRLRPRTYRLGEGQSVLMGGCARVDVVASPGATLYLTVWASDDIICHFGRTEGVDLRCARKQFCTKLVSCSCIGLLRQVVLSANRGKWVLWRRLEKHSGTTLVPPLGGMERLAALGPLQPCDVDVSGTSWKFSTVDVAIAGMLLLLTILQQQANPLSRSCGATL